MTALSDRFRTCIRGIVLAGLRPRRASAHYRSLASPETLFNESSFGFSRVLVILALLASAASHSGHARATGQAVGDGQHDFDFELGAWKAHIRRLVHPLSKSDSWVDLDGTSVVRKIWDGRGNLGELDVANQTMRLQGLSLRLYDPDARQWRIHWANSKDGRLGPPMIGGFTNGRGEFYDQEELEGKAIYVRFIFSDVTRHSFRFEQAFSSDGGKTWEPNWIATFTKERA